MFWFVCFLPIYAILGKKDQVFWKKVVKGVGNIQTQQGPSRKKLYCFEDPHCNRGGGKKGRLEFPRIRHDVSLGFDIRYGPHSSFYRGAFVHCMPFDGASHRSVQCFFLKGCFVIRNRPSGGSADICVYPTGDFNVGCLKLLFLKFWTKKLYGVAISRTDKIERSFDFFLRFLTQKQTNEKVT